MTDATENKGDWVVMRAERLVKYTDQIKKKKKRELAKKTSGISTSVN